MHVCALDVLRYTKYFPGMSNRITTRTAPAKRRAGRPRKPKDQKQSVRVLVSLTPGEFATLKALAVEAGLSISAFLVRPWRKES